MGRVAQTMGGAGTVDGGAVPADAPYGLTEILKAVAAHYDRAATDDERRILGLQQLMAIILHLQQEGIPGEALRPATAVAYALIDLDRGNNPAILKPSPRGGGRSVPFDELRQRGLAAAAVTLLIRADETEGHHDHKLDVAVRKAARRVEHWRAARCRRVVKSGRQSLPEAIKDWRERAVRGSSKGGPDARSYATMLELARQGPSPAWWAEWIFTEGHRVYR